MEWLSRPLTCEGATVAEPLDPSRLTEFDLPTICFRMHVILHTIEMPRAEERWLPVELFDSIDSLESMILDGHPSSVGENGPPRLSEWTRVIRQFGDHYQLTGQGPIIVNPFIYHEAANRYRRV
jgi:hypothetical protein